MLSLHPKYILDDNGNKIAVELPYDEWKEILQTLEEFDDIQAYDKAKSQPSDPVKLKDIKDLKDPDM